MPNHVMKRFSLWFVFTSFLICLSHLFLQSICSCLLHIVYNSIYIFLKKYLFWSWVSTVCMYVCIYYLKILFIQREGKVGRKRGRETPMWERNMDWLLHCLPPVCTPTQACTLTGTQTGDFSFYRTKPNLLSHTRQGRSEV